MKTIAAKLFLLFIFLCESLFVNAERVMIGDLYYELNESNKTASVTYPSSNSSSDENYVNGCVSIPSAVSYSGETYSVTSIGDSAFSACSGLTSIEIPLGVTSIGGSAFFGCSGLISIEIPSGVTSIGYWAFMGCSGLTSIKCVAIVPPSCGPSVFYGVDKSNCTLQVPEGCEAAYRSADEWKEFFFIEGVNDIRRIFGNDAVTVDVYTLDGALLRKGMDATQIATELPRGLYIINGRKVMVK